MGKQRSGTACQPFVDSPVRRHKRGAPTAAGRVLFRTRFFPLPALSDRKVSAYSGSEIQKGGILMAQITDFFAGANSGEGFRSLFSELVDIEDTYDLMVLKGGPGVGKNTFMREVARAMEAAGTAVERLWCSGDPDSLDGVVLPELRCAVVDGTSPHGSGTKGHPAALPPPGALWLSGGPPCPGRVPLSGRAALSRISPPGNLRIPNTPAICTSFPEERSLYRPPAICRWYGRKTTW